MDSMKKLLFISHRVPAPPDKGERIRAFHELRLLSQRFRVTLATLVHNAAEMQAVEMLRPLCESILTAPVGKWPARLHAATGLLKGTSLTQCLCPCGPLLQVIQSAGNTGPFDVAIAYSSAMAPCLDPLPCRRVADLVDVDSAKWAAYATEHSGLMRWLYIREARKVAAIEQHARRQCDATIVVTSAEAELLGEHDGQVHVIGNGVDCDYFTAPLGVAPGIRSAPTLVFTGTMSYRPNVQAVCWFVENVWSELKRNVPALRFVIVGREPAAAVRALARVEGVQVTGDVPDVRPYLADAAMAVFPLQMSPGVPNKLLEAMAAGLPAVASPCVTAGLDVRATEHVLHAQTPDQWREQVLRLLNSLELRSEFGQRARQHVKENFTWEKQLAPLVELCRKLSE
jgi:polysaccharide biosynthesis protein PslH